MWKILEEGKKIHLAVEKLLVKKMLTEVLCVTDGLSIIRVGSC